MTRDEAIQWIVGLSAEVAEQWVGRHLIPAVDPIERQTREALHAIGVSDTEIEINVSCIRPPTR